MSTPSWVSPETRALFDFVLHEYAQQSYAASMEAQRKFDLAVSDFFEAVRRDAVVSSMESDEATTGAWRAAPQQRGEKP